MSLADKMRSLSSSYQARVNAAIEQKRLDAERRAHEWELESVRGAKESIFPSIIAGAEATAESGLYRYTQVLQGGVGRESKYIDLVLPLLRRMLEAEGFQVTYTAVPYDKSPGAIGAVQSDAPYNHNLTIDW